MTNRTLTSLAIRFASLLLFIKIFEQFGAYFISIYYTSIIPLYENKLSTSFDKYYYNGTFLIICNIIISSFLFFKAEWVALKLIKNDNEINFELTPEKLIKVILLTTGIIWLATSLFSIPDLYDYIKMLFDKLNKVDSYKKVDFSPIYFIIKTITAFLFVYKVDKISLFLERKMNK